MDEIKKAGIRSDREAKAQRLTSLHSVIPAHACGSLIGGGINGHKLWTFTSSSLFHLSIYSRSCAHRCQ